MTSTVELPVWLFVLILLFAAVTFASHFLFPSVRWYFRRRMEKVVARVNERLERPIEPFRLARRYDMIQRLIYDPDVNQAIVDYAHRNKVPEAVAFQEAKSYAREIVPSFSASIYFGFAVKLAKFIATSFYRVRLGYYDEEGLKKIDRDASVVFVMNHKSNMDYVLVTYLAAERSALAYAAGEWARVWPLSRLIKAMGAYFIRRKSRNSLYRRVLASYVRMATEGGVTQAMFPEGGLSLNGAPQEPKLGLLKYITDGFNPEKRDIVFVPVALNYDRVFEDRVLLNALEGGGRRFHAKISVIAAFLMKQIWLRLRGRYNRFGYAAVSFGHPLSLTEFAKDRDGDLAEPLADALMQRIEEVIPVVPVPLVAAILLDAERPISMPQLVGAVAMQVGRLKDAHVHLPRDDIDYATEVGVRLLLRRKMIEKRAGCYSVVDDQRSAVAFYANSIRHFLE